MRWRKPLRKLNQVMSDKSGDKATESRMRGLSTGLSIAVRRAAPEAPAHWQWQKAVNLRASLQ